ncbi:MAG: exodeoxyribonuclease VII small subunit [Deltaproteobacteria bacterium]|nr:exodeoxyribonuclease VII small subunit [Deltaproteobacteria bacterium]
MPPAKKEPGFEKSLERLEQIVDKLEGDDLTLEKSLELFEEGIKLAQACGRQLDEAEKRVTLLLKDKDNHLVEAPFEPEQKED